jgi:hypothetical protein
MGCAFGFRRGHLKARADEIAQRGCRHSNHTEEDRTRRGWFECPRAPEAGEVLADMKDAGGAEN